MYYSSVYESPIGKLTLAASDDALTGLWIEDQKYFGGRLKDELIRADGHPILKEAEEWLNRYFAGEQPSVKELCLKPQGTEFQKEVWRLLCDIPYGEISTYGTLADKIARIRGVSSMSAQAIGGAIGHNPISIIIPCHRILGADGSFTGYAGGIDRKIWLLKHEHII